MRVVVTWIVAIAIITTLVGLWYVSQPLLVASSNLSQGISQAGDWNTTGSDQTYTLIRLGANIGIPIAIIFTLIWAIVSSQAEDWRGEYA